MRKSAATQYDAGFYRRQRSGSSSSAAEVVPLVIDLIGPRSVVDVGCGQAPWLAVFQECGIQDVFGIDGDYVDRKMLAIPRERFLMKDLNQPFSLERQFDLALSLEVAEHLKPEASVNFIRSLTALSKLVLFSAAIPGQGGTAHINEQWPDFWVGLFREQGFTLVDCLRDRIWNNSRVEPWYRQNLLLFVQNEHLKTLPLLKEIAERGADRVVSVVHPEIFWDKGPGMNLLVLLLQCPRTLRLAVGRNRERLRKLVNR